ncbi:MAG TPA: hypothetical protein VHS28_05085 [Chloroflexota bacterium]|nr:hypothetical protein [Chloroflexota bacterium]
MAEQVWTLSHLTEEQERLLKEAESTLGSGVLLAFSPEQVQPADLTQDQLECLQGLEQKLGMAVVAVRK